MKIIVITHFPRPFSNVINLTLKHNLNNTYPSLPPLEFEIEGLFATKSV